MRDVLGLGRSQLLLRGGEPVSAADLARFRDVVRRRCLREPLQYILGRCEFWSRDFIVSPAVLVPRPETEFLLEHILAVLGDRPAVRRPLDLCTGSGVIAIVLAMELARPVLATDCSPAALAVARANAGNLGVADRVRLLCSDLFSALAPEVSFDLIVSNPPYIAESEMATLQPEVGQWEPRLALAGGKDGLDVIRRIVGGCRTRLRPGGWLFMEIGVGQRQGVLDLFLGQHHLFSDVEVVPDWAGRARVLQARRNDRKRQ